MKRVFFILAFILSVFFLLPVGGWAEESAARIHSVQADFRQEKQLEILARPIISSGTFVFQAPQSLRWEYLSPVHSILLVHGGKVRRFIERNGEFREERDMAPGAMQVVLTEIANWLEGRFTDNTLFTVSSQDKGIIRLVPREKGLAALITSIELKLADQFGLLDEVTIFEGPGSFTRLTFSNRILNEEIPLSTFTAR